ncbi:MAG: PD40 domain-containing protein [Ardenticatenales bacterium]|nr:PD40 domain-containing protein [Ardenticatenales bacterium]
MLPLAAASSDRAGGCREIVFDDTATGVLQGPTDLYAIQPSGVGRRQLTNTDDMAEAQPSWSPDRRSVAYTGSLVGDDANAWGIWVLNAATGERRQLTSGPNDFEPDWRPDGASILFTRITRTGNAIAAAELAVVAPDGTGYRPIVRLSDGSGTIGNPSWSPDGRRIAFTLARALDGGELYVANADGTETRRLLAHGGWDDIDSRWSPDGRYLAFASGANQAGPVVHDIWLMDLTTGIVGTVAHHALWNLRRPTWSPDGRRLVFAAHYQDSPPAGRCSRCRPLAANLWGRSRAESSRIGRAPRSADSQRLCRAPLPPGRRLLRPRHSRRPHHQNRPLLARLRRIQSRRRSRR